MRFKLQGTVATADLHGLYQQDAKHSHRVAEHRPQNPHRAAGDPRLPKRHRPAGHDPPGLLPPPGKGHPAQPEPRGNTAAAAITPSGLPENHAKKRLPSGKRFSCFCQLERPRDIGPGVQPSINWFSCGRTGCYTARVEAAFFQQALVVALLDDVAVPHHQDGVPRPGWWTAGGPR